MGHLYHLGAVRAPSFCIMVARRDSTVRGLILRALATSAFVHPSHSRRSTSIREMSTI